MAAPQQAFPARSGSRPGLAPAQAAAHARQQGWQQQPQQRRGLHGYAHQNTLMAISEDVPGLGAEPIPGSQGDAAANESYERHSNGPMSYVGRIIFGPNRFSTPVLEPQTASHHTVFPQELDEDRPFPR